MLRVPVRVFGRDAVRAAGWRLVLELSPPTRPRGTSSTVRRRVLRGASSGAGARAERVGARTSRATGPPPIEDLCCESDRVGQPSPGQSGNTTGDVGNHVAARSPHRPPRRARKVLRCSRPRRHAHVGALASAGRSRAQRVGRIGRRFCAPVLRAAGEPSSWRQQGWPRGLSVKQNDPRRENRHGTNSTRIKCGAAQAWPLIAPSDRSCSIETKNGPRERWISEM